MFGYMIIFFTVVPALELAVLIKVGGYIGVGNTLTIIILTGVMGAYLARLQGFLVLQEIQEKLSQGQMPSTQLLDGLMILVGGLVLLTPGFITDVMGFILLIPWTRALIKILLQKKFESMIKQGQGASITINSIHHNPEEYDDIDI